MQQQKIRMLELQLEEAKKLLESTEKAISQDDGTLGLSAVGSRQVSVESLWGYGGRIRSSTHNAAVTNKLTKEADPIETKRDVQAQKVIELSLRLEAAHMTLDTLLRNSQ